MMSDVQDCGNKTMEYYQMCSIDPCKREEDLTDEEIIMLQKRIQSKYQSVILPEYHPFEKRILTKQRKIQSDLSKKKNEKNYLDCDDISLCDKLTDEQIIMLQKRIQRNYQGISKPDYNEIEFDIVRRQRKIQSKKSTEKRMASDNTLAGYLISCLIPPLSSKKVEDLTDEEVVMVQKKIQKKYQGIRKPIYEYQGIYEHSFEKQIVERQRKIQSVEQQRKNQSMKYEQRVGVSKQEMVKIDEYSKSIKELNDEIDKTQLKSQLLINKLHKLCDDEIKPYIDQISELTDQKLKFCESLQNKCIHDIKMGWVEQCEICMKVFNEHEEYMKYH